MVPPIPTSRLLVVVIPLTKRLSITEVITLSLPIVAIPIVDIPIIA